MVYLLSHNIIYTPDSRERKITITHVIILPSPLSLPDMVKGSVGDMACLGVTESFQVKRQVLLSAAEAAEMILRVDNVLKAAPRYILHSSCIVTFSAAFELFLQHSIGGVYFYTSHNRPIFILLSGLKSYRGLMVHVQIILPRNLLLF